MDRVGAIAPARFLCIAKQDSFSEVIEVSHTVAGTFKNFGFVVTTLNEAICPRDFQGVNNLMEPVVVGFGAVMELRQIHDLNREQPVCKGFLAFFSGLAADYSKEIVFNAVGICQPGSNFKH